MGHRVSEYGEQYTWVGASFGGSTQTMPTPRSSSHRAGPRRRSSAPHVGTVRVLRGQLAVRYKPDASAKVRSALTSLGEIEPSSGGMLILHHASTSAPKVRKVLAALETDGLIDFVTPVLRDVRSGTRQILTDEITIRFRSDAPIKGTLSKLRAKEGVSVTQRNAFARKQFIIKVAHPSGTRTLDVAKRLDARDDIEFAAPNYITEIKR